MGGKKISISLQYGLIAAGAVVLFILGTYWAGPKVFVGGTAFLTYLIAIAFAVAAVMVKKKANGGFLTFEEAVKTSFVVIVIALAMRTLFPWLLVNYIDPHFRERLIPEMVAQTENGYRKFGASEDKIRELVESLRKEPFPLGPMLMDLALSYIVFFFISLLIAAILKRKPGTK
ncbi:MAG: DUF4199 domain-containing protein [Bacteroidetes bacterium]|nr:DUF4199 domain-containing protein [Bacteroidota bacterium]